MSPARAAAPPGYVHAASDYGDELARLRLLQERYDERTFARPSARWSGSEVGPCATASSAQANSRPCSPPSATRPSRSWMR